MESAGTAQRYLDHYDRRVSPKTLSGEELVTTDGQPTNALLGFTNMLFKLLADYRPKGVAVAWDSRPVHRAAVAEAADVVYKEGRRPMPDLLREQFPHFRPIV